MKNFYTAVASILLVSATFAQTNTSIVLDEVRHVLPKDQELLDQITIKKANEIKSSSLQTNKGPVNGRVDYAARLVEFLGSVEYGFINPIMPDSTTWISFTSSTVSPRTHGIGMVYDPTDSFFGAESFKSTDVVNVDSLFVDGSYWINNSAHTNDSIIFRVFIAPPNSSGPFNVTSFASLTGLSGTINIPYLDYTGSASHGVYDGITGTTTARYGHQMTQADSAGVVSISVQTPGLTIPAGSVMGVFVEFIPTSFVAGDTTNLVTDSGAFNAFRPLAVVNTGGSLDFNTFSGLANGSFQHNAISLGNVTRYNPAAINTSHIGGTTYSLSRVSNSIYATVSGNSSVGIDDLEKDVSFNVFPNPSNGMFNINIESNTANMAQLSVKNIVGQTIISKTISVSGQTIETISLTDHSKGVYFLTVNNETIKIIVE